MLREPMLPRLTAHLGPFPARAAGRAACIVLALSAQSAVAQELTETDRIDITGRQNLTLGSGARAYGMGGSVQLSYQRAISFDGTRRVEEYVGDKLLRIDDGRSDGGFDVIAAGTGLRLSRHVRAGLTVNRWLNGYGQNLNVSVLNPLSDLQASSVPPIRYALTTNRLYASISYRFSGRWLP